MSLTSLTDELEAQSLVVATVSLVTRRACLDQMMVQALDVSRWTACDNLDNIPPAYGYLRGLGCLNSCINRIVSLYEYRNSSRIIVL